MSAQVASTGLYVTHDMCARAVSTGETRYCCALNEPPMQLRSLDMLTVDGVLRWLCVWLRRHTQVPAQPLIIISLCKSMLRRQFTQDSQHALPTRKCVVILLVLITSFIHATTLPVLHMRQPCMGLAVAPMPVSSLQCSQIVCTVRQDTPCRRKLFTGMCA